MQLAQLPTEEDYEIARALRAQHPFLKEDFYEVSIPQELLTPVRINQPYISYVFKRWVEEGILSPASSLDLAQRKIKLHKDDGIRLGFHLIA